MLPSWFLEKLLDPLGLFGLAAQSCFMLRFVVQWFVSERRGRSYVPVAFWYLSLVGGAMTFIYAVLRQDPVFALAQALGLAIYTRNLVLIYRRRSRTASRHPRSDAEVARAGAGAMPNAD
jgi:lipid-A-disaccharide synthase-like uncharacterized protein